jgi:hypothetical protein
MSTAAFSLHPSAFCFPVLIYRAKGAIELELLNRFTVMFTMIKYTNTFHQLPPMGGWSLCNRFIYNELCH